MLEVQGRQLNIQLRDFQQEILNDRSRFKVAVVHRRAGKTVLGLLMMLIGCRRPNRRYWYIAPTYRSAKMIAWDELKRMLPKSAKINEVELSAIFPNGSRIELKGAENPDALRGAGLNGVVLDEFSEQQPKLWTEVVLPMLADRNGWAFIVGTPKGRNKFYELYQEAKQTENWNSWLYKASDTRILPAHELDQLQKSMAPEEYQQEFECFPEGTDVITNSGVQDISAISVGDYVLAHSGRYRKVTQTFRRKYSGDLVRLKTYGNNKDILCTPAHPIRVYKNSTEHDWVDACKVQKGDKVVFPKVLLGKYKIISKELAELIAWFIAEGNYYDKNINFSLSAQETAYAQRIKSALATITDKRVHCSVRRGAMVLTISDCELGEFFIKHCGSGADQKRIPFELIGGWEQVVYDTLIDGDGCRVGKFTDVYSTISKTLVYQFQILANSLGYPCGISHGGKANNSTIEGRKVSVSPSYVARANKGKKSRLRIQNKKYDCSAVVISVEREAFDGTVYNLGVQVDNSYTANGREVHNCSFLTYAGLVYKEFQPAFHTFKLPQVSFGDDWGRYIGIDFGYRDPTAIVWVAVSPQKDFYVYREWYKTEQTLDEIKEALLNMTGQELIRARVGDSARPDSIEQLNKWGLPAVGSTKGQHSIVDGINMIKSLMKIDGYTRKPKLFIAESCPELIREVKLYAYKEPEEGKPVDEVPIDMFNHALDALRYVVMHVLAGGGMAPQPDENLDDIYDLDY